MGKTLGVTDLKADAAQKQTDAQLTDSITNGKGAKMPAYKGKLRTIRSKGWSASFATWRKSSQAATERPRNRRPRLSQEQQQEEIW